jgi:hypothetical protein
MVDLAEQGIYIIVAMFGFLFWFMDYRNTKRMNKMDAARYERETKEENTEDILQKLKQSVYDYVKANMIEYIEHELNYLKKEIGWAIKLVDKDIHALKEAVNNLNQNNVGAKRFNLNKGEDDDNDNVQV